MVRGHLIGAAAVHLHSLLLLGRRLVRRTHVMMR